jgi:hypothetical protein
MPDGIDLGVYCGRPKPLTIRVDGTRFVAHPPTFAEAEAMQQALAVLVATTAGQGTTAVRWSDVRPVVRAVLQHVRFRGWLPDCVQRWRLRRALLRGSEVGAYAALVELVAGFWRSLGRHQSAIAEAAGWTLPGETQPTPRD